MKPQTWQKMVGGEYVELYHFDEERNLVCLNGRKAVVCENGGTHHRGPDGLEPEVPKEPNIERLIKKLSKKKTDGRKAKYKYRKGTAAKR